MLLSIGMIVKNEEKYLRQCLEGLKPILEQVHSELIIYDTGSTDATVEIANEFTKKVYHCEWRGDFAWARNQTVDKAFGKWYMFMDADEIIEDATELIQFFNSGEYKKYGCASLNMDNKQKNNQSNLFLAMRLFKVYPGMKFVGTIHEYIQGIAPVKNLNVPVAHYGYLHDSEETRKVKHERNLPPLLKLHEEDPTDPRHINHLISEYGGKNDEEVIRYIRMGLDLIDGKPESQYFHTFHYRLVSYYNDRKEWEAVLNAVEDYFEKSTIESIADINIRSMESWAYHKLERYTEAAETSVKTLNAYDKGQAGQLNNLVALSMALATPFNNRDKAVDSVVFNYMMADNFDTALEWDAQYSQSKKGAIFNMYAVEAVKREKYENLAKAYDYAIKKFELDSPMHDSILDAIESVLIKPEVKEAAADAVMALDYPDNDYVRLMKLRKNKDLADLHYFLTSDKTFGQHFTDVLSVAIEKEQDFSNFLNNFNVDNTPLFISKFIHANKDVNTIIANLVEKGFPPNSSLKYQRIISTLAMVVFERIKAKIAKKDEEENAYVLNFYEKFIQMRYQYLSNIYQPDVFSHAGIEALPEQDRFIYYSGQAFISKNKNDTADFARNIKMALRANRSMKDVIQLVGNQIKEQESTPPPPTAQDALTQETAKLKSIINTMIAVGNLSQAAQILDSYALVNPGDPDIETIKMKLQK